MRLPRRCGSSLLDVLLGFTLIVIAVSAFAGLYPPAAQSSRAPSDFAQAIGAAQHKIDQLRSIGYGRLTYTEMKNAGIIDSSPSTSPFRFEVVDTLSSTLQAPIGSITLSSGGVGITQVIVRLTWQASPRKTSTHEVYALICQD